MIVPNAGDKDFRIQEMDRNEQKFPAYFQNVGKYS